MKLVKVSGALVAGFLLMAVASSAWADIPTSDNFDDGVKSPAWGDDMLVGDGLNAVLSETNGHLEFAGSSSEIEDIVILRPWVAGMGSYTQNWEVATDVNVGALNLPQYVGIEMFLVVASADNETLGDRLVITLCLEEMERGFEVVPAVNNTELFAVPNYGYNSTAETNGRLRVAFDASTKILTASYDAIPLGLLDVDDALTDWGMDASSGFSFALGGSMWGDYTNSSSEVSADNFEFRSGDDLEYVLAINSGTGGGNYTNNAEVIIAASAAPSGQIFDHWVGSTQYLASVTAATTTVTMPAQAITLTATYTLRGTASGDDFDDNSKDMARWGDDIHFSTTNIFLNEINGRLEVLKSAGLDASGVFRPWVESTGSYTQDWETEADVHLSGISLDSGTSVNVNLAVANQDDATFGDTLSIALDLHNDDDDTYRGYEMNSKVNGSDLAAVPNYGYVATGDTDGRVKIAFDADSKILTASFNGNVLGWIDVDDPASNWEMTTNSLFAVAIAGSVHGASVGLASGDLYADNFSITFPSVPLSGTLVSMHKSSRAFFTAEDLAGFGTLTSEMANFL
nr:hypothetical protein [Planctomycetota bacterium]